MLCYPQNNRVYKYRQDSFLWAVAGQHETSRGQSEREAEKLPSGPIQGVVSNTLGPAIRESNRQTLPTAPKLLCRAVGSSCLQYSSSGLWHAEHGGQGTADNSVQKVHCVSMKVTLGITN